MRPVCGYLRLAGRASAGHERMRVIAGEYNLASGDVPEVDGRPVEPWSVAAAYERLRRVAPSVPVSMTDGVTLLPGDSNDAWATGDAVLRICWRGDRGRLLREVEIARVLPAAIPYPRVRAHGSGRSYSWALADRVPGETLAATWRREGRSETLHRLLGDLLTLLRALHEWAAPAGVLDLLDPGLWSEEPLAVVGRSVVPLPVARTRRLVAYARTMPFVDPALMDAVDQRLQDLADADAPPDRAEAVIHGDASLSNVIVHDGRIKALLDFEWATMGRRDQDLLTVLRSLQLYRPPGMSPAGSAAFGLDCVRGTYPELLSPGIERRMWLYELAFNVRGLIVWPAYAPEAVLDPRHPARQLRALVDRPSHLAVDQAADR